MGTSNGTGTGPGKDCSYQKIKNDSSRSCGSHSTENTELNDESEEPFNDEIYPPNSTTRPHRSRKSTLNKTIVILSVLTIIFLAVLGILVGFSYFMCGSYFGLVVRNCETTTSTTESTAPTNLNNPGTGGYVNIEDHPNFKYFPQQLSECGHPATSLLLRQNENRKNSGTDSPTSGAGSKSRKRRIVGGDDVLDKNAFPWMVKITTSHFNGTHNESRFACGGTLITNRHVLTSAHCVYAENVVGVRLNDKTGTEVKAESVLINSNYEDILDEYLELFETYAVDMNQIANLNNSESHDNISTEAEIGFDTFLRLHLNPHRSYDIAIIRLDRDVNSNWTNFSPICLPLKKYYKLTDPKDFDYAGAASNPLYSAGWGFTNPNINESSVSKAINYLSLPFVGNSRCQDLYYTNDTNITSKMICAGAIKGQDLCQGDSGGPLFLEVKGRSFQVGVAAFGKERCDIGAPTVFVNVSRFIKWILDSLEP